MRVCPDTGRASIFQAGRWRTVFRQHQPLDVRCLFAQEFPFPLFHSQQLLVDLVRISGDQSPKSLLEVQLLEKGLLQVGLPVQPQAPLVEPVERRDDAEAQIPPPVRLRDLAITPSQVPSQPGELADEIFEGNRLARPLLDQVEEPSLGRIRRSGKMGETPKTALVVALHRWQHFRSLPTQPMVHFVRIGAPRPQNSAAPTTTISMASPPGGAHE